MKLIAFAALSLFILRQQTILVSEQIIKQHIIGRWQLDSIISPGQTSTDKILRQEIKKKPSDRIKVKADGKIIYYSQSQFRKDDDIVVNEEFNDNGKHITTTINAYSVKNEQSGKQSSTEEYLIQGNNIISILRWGRNNKEETKSTMVVLKINSVNLVYKTQTLGQMEIYYLSKLQ